MKSLPKIICGSPLHQAVSFNDVQSTSILLQAGADPNSRDLPIESGDSYGNTPLHHAVSISYFNTQTLIEKLIEAHALIDAVNNKSRTALMKAVKKNNLQATVTLLNLGADANLHDCSGVTALHHAARNCKDNATILIEKLIAAGAEIEAQDVDYETPLHKAAYYGMGETVNFLLRKGANTFAKNRYGATPLHKAVLSRDSSFEKVKALLEYGASPNEPNNLGTTSHDLAKKSQPGSHSLRMLRYMSFFSRPISPDPDSKDESVEPKPSRFLRFD